MGATATSLDRKSVFPILLQRLREARSRTDDLFAIVRPEALYDRPIPERHRIVFYLGHLEAFDWNLLGGSVLGVRPFNAAFDQLFAFGIDPVDDGLPTDEPKDWPGRPEVDVYRHTVRSVLDDALASSTSLMTAAAGSDELSQLLHVAIEHRLMHAETLTYMLHQLPLNRKFHIAGLSAPAVRHTARAMVTIPAGTATLGLTNAAGGPFGWDNEFIEHTIAVPAFEIDAHQVTNRQFLAFVEDGGYQRRQLWNDANWEWREENKVSHPAFWVSREGQWYYRDMFDEVPLPMEWPVYVSHAEAAAYASWAGKELPTEAEWHRAAYSTPEGHERSYPWGEDLPQAKHGNFDFARWSPTPVNSFPAGNSAFGVADLLGNGWEWTRTPFAPFEGFVPFSFYAGYSANFFDNEHYVMKGGSARTAGCMLRRSFRNWFQPHYQYVYASFRCVQH
jgi:iron(II)-dependent oxidoreductase